jgi:hypothetical protein
MKKIILSVLAAAAMGTTLSAPLMANAREVNLGQNTNISFLQARSSYDVFYKRSRFEGWKYYGSYSNKFIAKATVFRLETQWFKAYYERY